MAIQDSVSNEQIDKKLESFVEVVLQKMIDLHQEIKELKRRVHEQDKKLQQALKPSQQNQQVVDERININI